MKDMPWSYVLSSISFVVLVGIFILAVSIKLDIATIKENTDPAKVCNGQILFNDQFQVFECKDNE